MQSETLNNKNNNSKKFFFDMHNFDDDALEGEDENAQSEEEKDDLPPPPPVFSQGELEAAKKAAYEDGLKKGIEQTEASSEKTAALALQDIAAQIPGLQQAEAERSKTYETETVRLALSLFEKVLPHYNKTYGFEELQNAIISILQKQGSSNHISIFIHNDVAENVKNKIEEMARQTGIANIEVHEDSALNPGACKMKWKDGGAIYDIDALAQEITDCLREMLAGRDGKGHDEDESVTTQNTTPEPEKETPEDDTLREKPDE